MGSMKNWQGIPTTRLTLGGELMVPRDNSTLAFSTELFNYIIAFATQGKSGYYKAWSSYCRKDRKHVLATMSQKGILQFSRCRLQKSLVRDRYYQKNELTCEKNCLLIANIVLTESLVHGCCLRSPALSQVCLSLTLQLSQTAVVKVVMSSTFPTIPGQVKQFTAIIFQ